VALAGWAGAALAYPALVVPARRRGPAAEILARRRFHWLLGARSAAFLAVLATGLLAMRVQGWGIDYPRWLSLKLGLVAFLLLPLEAIDAYAVRRFLARGLARAVAPAFPRDLERGVSMQQMVWALALPLYGLALPVLLWLSLARPF